MLASGMFTGQDQVPSRFATVTADLGNLIQQVISVLVFLAQSLSVEFRARIAAQTSFRGPDCSARGVCLLDDLSGRRGTDPLSKATPAPSVKRRARDTRNAWFAGSFDERHDICNLSPGSQCMHTAAAS
jgi:hypothetical protein